MKTYFLLLFFLLGAIDTFSSQLKSEVSECFELTSIAFRLADASEYINDDVISYANDIDNYFTKYKEHELILFLKEIREQHGVSYDAVAIAAAYLEVKDGRVVIKPKADISKINEVDSRWSEPIYKTLVALLDDFYRKTKFRNFYLQHNEIYSIAVMGMDQILQSINVEWFKSVFANEFDDPLVIISLSNGSHNYAFAIPGIGNGIVVGCGVNAKGLPAYRQNHKFIIVHELLHNYTNSMIGNIWEEINLPSQKIYSSVKEEMNKNAYGDSQVAMSEWFTNLLSIMYVQSNPIRGLEVEYLTKQCQNIGFIWMERSVRFMEHFCHNRNQFISMDDYMSQIVGFINYTAYDFDQISDEYDNRHPYIVDIFPSSGSTFDPDIDNTIEIRFSEVMLGTDGLSPAPNEEIVMIPFTVGMFVWKDECTFAIPLKKGILEKGKKYGFQFNPDFFQSQKRYKMKNDYIYTFNTRK